MSAGARASLDRVLELLEQRRLSAMELRLLLGLIDREASVPELAEALGQRPARVARAARRLSTRGLVRWRHADKGGETRLAITAAGSATMRAFLTTASRAAGEAATPDVAVR